MGAGSASTVQNTPSEQGGAVRLPSYEKNSLLLRESKKAWNGTLLMFYLNERSLLLNTDKEAKKASLGALFSKHA